MLKRIAFVVNSVEIYIYTLDEGTMDMVSALRVEMYRYIDVGVVTYGLASCISVNV